MFRPTASLCITLALGLGIVNALSARPLVQQQKDPQLAKAIFLYETNDISGQVPPLLAQAALSKDAGTVVYARYYLGRYYQQAYYVSAAKYSLLKPDYLRQAVTEYDRFLGVYRKPNADHTLVSDVGFYKALAQLQLGDVKSADATLAAIDPKMDPEVFVYDIVWSADLSSVPNRNFPTSSLRDTLRRLIQQNAKAPSANARFQSVQAAMKAWCRGRSKA